MRTPFRTPSLSLCVLVLALGLAGCGGGGGGGGGGGAVLPPTWQVTNLNNAGAGSLRHAVNNAPDGAWIIFDSSLATGTINLASSIPIDRPIVIGGLSGTLERFTISGNNTTRLFEVSAFASLDLRDLVLTQGHEAVDDGGAIEAVDATLILSRVSIISCHAPNGGGGAIRHSGGPLLMVDCAITACTALWGGAIWATDMTGHAERCSFYLNTASISIGGALHLVSAHFTLLDSTVDSNQAPQAGARGGGISVISHGNYGPAQLTIWSSTITNNSADNAGGVYARVQDGEPCSVVSSYSIVAGNNAGTGADFLFNDGAIAQGVENVIGVGDGSYFFNGVGMNQVGDAFTPLDPELAAVSFHSFGRAKRQLQPGSPARNVVSTASILRPNGAPLLLDQLGEARVQSGAPDIGAVEQ